MKTKNKQQIEAENHLGDLKEFLDTKFLNLEVAQDELNNLQKDEQNYYNTFKLLQNYIKLQTEINEKIPKEDDNEKEQHEFLRFLRKEKKLPGHNDDKQNPLEQMAFLSKELKNSIKELNESVTDPKVKDMLNKINQNEILLKLSETQAEYQNLNQDLNKITTVKDKRKLEDMIAGIGLASCAAISATFATLGLVSLVGMYMMIPTLLVAPPLFIVAFSLGIAGAAFTTSVAATGLIMSGAFSAPLIASCVHDYQTKNKVSSEEVKIINDIKAWTSKAITPSTKKLDS